MSEQNVKVVCRFRPLNQSEIRCNNRIAVQFHGNDDNSVSLQVSHKVCNYKVYAIAPVTMILKNSLFAGKSLCF